MINTTQTGLHQKPQGTAGEVFKTFLKLGLTSFGGPIAHLGYFRAEIVQRRLWLSDQAYADLVALCQFLPGPASSQVGFALGMMRAGWLGALAAFTAFTLPSAALLFVFAMTSAHVSGVFGLGAVHGLKIVAVAIVAQAVWGMARTLCPDKERASIAVLAVALLAFLPSAWSMVGAIVLGALISLALRRGTSAMMTGADLSPSRISVSRRAAFVSLALLIGLLITLPLVAAHSQTLAVIDSFFRAGALVFGGGHVVLPLLETEIVQSGWVTPDAFLAGYGAAQAVPGPLFTFAAYLGAVLGPAPHGFLGAVLALLSVFLPGFLILIAVLPFWDQFRAMSTAQSLMQGANAAVVGILGAALYSPVFTSAIASLKDLTLALTYFVALMVWKWPPWVVVLMGAVGGVVLALMG